jgi:(p)ppGpp synthase/HD superfamily hydrolase
MTSSINSSNSKFCVSGNGEKGLGDEGKKNTLSSQFESALVYAARLHQAQRRKVNGVPYVSHLLSVAALVLEDGGDEEEAIAALLHDAVEDQGGEATLQEIRRRFGDRVAEIVTGCTALPQLPGQNWREHKRQYLAQVRQASASVQRVVLADKLHNGRCLLANLRECGPRMWQVFSGSQADLVWFYQECVRLFESMRSGWMVEELRQVTNVLNS